MLFKSLILVTIVLYSVHCVSIQEAQKNPLEAYVLTDQSGKILPNSGVRIGPLNLKFITPNMLKKANISQEMIQKFQPYFNKSGEEAQTLLQSKPLKLTQQEYDDLSNNVLAFMRQKFNRLPAMVRNNPRVSKMNQLAEQRDWPVFLQQTDEILQKMAGFSGPKKGGNVPMSDGNQ